MPKAVAKTNEQQGASKVAPGLPEKPAKARSKKIADVDSLLARMSTAKDHYEVLTCARGHG